MQRVRRVCDPAKSSTVWLFVSLLLRKEFRESFYEKQNKMIIKGREEELLRAIKEKGRTVKNLRGVFMDLLFTVKTQGVEKKGLLAT